MGEKSKVFYEDTLKACESYINCIASACQIADRFGINSSRVRQWIRNYRVNRPEALLLKLKNNSYTKECKINAVEE